jgi:hypothetical protein
MPMKNSHVATVGRQVWFYERAGAKEQAATVSFDYPPQADGSQEVDLTVTPRHTLPFVISMVPIGDFGQVPAAGPFCTWMPYQVKRHEELKAKGIVGGGSESAVGQ